MIMCKKFKYTRILYISQNLFKNKKKYGYRIFFIILPIPNRLLILHKLSHLIKVAVLIVLEIPISNGCRNMNIYSILIINI